MVSFVLYLVCFCIFLPLFCILPLLIILSLIFLFSTYSFNCPIGQFQDDKGQTECKDCREDRYGVELRNENTDELRPALSNAEWYV